MSSAMSARSGSSDGAGPADEESEELREGEVMAFEAAAE